MSNSIWLGNPTVKECNDFCSNTIHDALGIRISEVGEDYLCGTMIIDQNTKQPYGLLHGGASVVLAESLGSLASNLMLDNDKVYAVGQSITANHVRPGVKGLAHGKATLKHRGKTVHIWNIDVTNDQGKLLCVCTLQMTILKR